jgi:hypothetical protein
MILVFIKHRKPPLAANLFPAAFPPAPAFTFNLSRKRKTL